MEQAKITIVAKIFLAVFLFISLIYLFVGFTTVPTEGDSLAYHIPIAKSVLTGGVFHPSNKGFGLEYYPGSAEAILSLFLLLHLPMDLFNVLGVVILFFLLKQLGRVVGMSKELSYIYSVVVCTMPSIIRLYPNQTVDIWVAVFFTAIIVLLEKPKDSVMYFLLLGIAMGFLIGSKYSGPMYLIVLLVFYFPKIKKFIFNINALAVLPGILLIGCSWYLRNLVITGDPVYPGHFLFFKGKENFRIQNKSPLRTVLSSGGAVAMGGALVSEFLVWAFALFTPILGLFQRAKFTKKMWQLTAIGILNFIIYLFLPSGRENIISDLRYTYPAFIPLIVVVFLYAKSIEKETELILISLLSLIAVISQLDYHPKLYIIFILVISLYFIFEKRITSLLRK